MLLRSILFGIFFIANHFIYASCIGLGCTCTTSATGLAFGSYNPLLNVNVDNMNTVSVTCSALIVGLDVSYVIALNPGLNGSFTTSRRMKNGTSNFLNYNIYTTTARTVVWGDGTSSTATISDAYLLNLLSVTRNYTAYGRIPSAQNPIPGSYTDTVTVTVTY
ncbi:MAG: spore coat U domain-containing protein [Proteobacteria bacterium]|nr:spore coat U domain-containing protein [Pseudomonadota bacterium]